MLVSVTVSLFLNADLKTKKNMTQQFVVKHGSKESL